jgi:hypothetical protein
MATGQRAPDDVPDDKYLPSYLVWAAHGGGMFHVLFAIDIKADHVTVVTAYRPDARDWESDLRTRRRKS